MKKIKHSSLKVFVIVIGGIVILGSIAIILSPYVDDFYMNYKVAKIRGKLADDPYSEKLHYELSQIYFKGGEIDKYENELRLLKQISPRFYLYSEKLGDHYAMLRQFDKAINFYNEAIKLYQGDNANNLLYLKLANSYVNLEEYEKAIETYKMQLTILDTVPDKQKTQRIRQFIIETIQSIEQRKVQNHLP